MPYVYFNPNPRGASVGDCVIRAISKAMDRDWDDIYTELSLQGFMQKDMPSSNIVWGTYLIEHSFEEGLLPRNRDYTIRDFCRDYPTGTYVVGTDSHACCVLDGSLYDSYDSSYMHPTYYFKKIEV